MWHIRHKQRSIKKKVGDEQDSDGYNSDENGRKLGRFCDTKLCWYQPPIECLPVDFCNNTSLHGLKYLGQSKRHLTERIFWMLSFVIGCSAAVYLISDVWRRYNEAPVIVSFEPEETKIYEIPFPAVTICNMNKVLKSKAIDPVTFNSQSDPTHKTLQKLYYQDHVCSSSKSFTKRFNLSSGTELNRNLVDEITKELENANRSRFDVTNYLKLASQPCPDMIRNCLWQDKVINCSEIFRPVETDFGKCCTFNMVPQTLLHRFRTDVRDNQAEVDLWNITNLEETWLPAVNHKYTNKASEENLRPRRQNQAGKSFGLSILLDPDLEEYFCTTSDSVGFRLATHLSTENPHVIDYGIAVMPNSEVFISVRPELTKADSTIHGYPLDSRKCYFPYEHNLTFYEYYSASNCIDECVAASTYDSCKCVRYYMPRNDQKTLCGPKDFNCAEKVKSDLSDIGLKKNCSHCLPACNEITYFEETTTTPLQTNNSWSSRNVSIVHIYFGQDSTYARIRKELFGTTDLFGNFDAINFLLLLANTGGLMGLCLGFSGLSAMEVLYFLTLRAWCKKRRKKTFGAKVAAKFRDIWIKVKNRKKYGDGKGSPTTSKKSMETRHPTPTILDQDFGGIARLNFAHFQKPIPESGRILKKTKSFVEQKPMEDPLPLYTTIVQEISPFYANRHGSSFFNAKRGNTNPLD